MISQLTKYIASRIYVNKAFLSLYRPLIIIFRKTHGAVIVNFHRFYDENDGFLQKGPSVHTNIKVFDRLLSLLVRRYKVISLDDLVDHLNSNTPLKQDSVVITIDDGYEDNYRLALPILLKYKIPGTLYVATGYIGTDKILPMDRVDYALRKTNKKYINWPLLGKDALPIDRLENLGEVNRLIGQYVKTLSKDELENTIDELYSELEVEPYIGKRIMLNWDEVKILKENNIDIGSHGVSHTCMTRLSFKEAVKELQESKETIMERTGRIPKHFAYPNGMRDDFSKELENQAKDIGYSSVASVIRGINVPGSTDQYDLYRVGLTSDPERTMLYIEKLFYRDC